MSYRKRILCLTLVVASLEFILCNHILACCSAKKFNKPKEEARETNPTKIAIFASSYYVEDSVYGYTHDIYFRNKGLFYKFFLQQHTTSRAYYLCWTIFEHALKNLTGVVWIYKTWKNFEFYYGSVVGIGWYPREFDFNKYFRVGFFDMSINLITLFMHFCHLFCNLYFKGLGKTLYNEFKSSLFQEGGKYNWKLFFALKCEKTIGTMLTIDTKKIDTKKTLGYYIDRVISFSELSLWCAFSFINIKTAFGIKIKFVRLIQIVKFIKFVRCAICSNISLLAYRIPQSSQNKVSIDYPSENIFIYSYNYESHFFFGERDSIFWMLLELFIPSIEICLNHDDF